MTRMCTDVTVMVEVALTDLVRKLIENNRFGFNMAVVSDDNCKARIIIAKSEEDRYEIPAELPRENLGILLMALERDVKGAAPHVSLVMGGNGEALKPYKVLMGPGSGNHSRSAFVATTLCRMEWSRVSKNKNIRIDRFLIEQARPVLKGDCVEIEREMLFEHSSKVSKLRTKPALPALVGDNANWKKPASALVKRWECTEPFCSSHYSA